MKDKNKKQKHSDLRIKYFDVRARVGSIGSPKELSIPGKKRDEMIKKMSKTTLKLQGRLEVVFNKCKDDEQTESLLAYDIGELQKYKKILDDNPDNLIEVNVASMNIMGISEAIKLYEAFYDINIEEVTDFS